MAAAFLANCGLTDAQIARVAYLVGHHHTLRGIDGIDYQILIEADYIANASENGCSRESIEIFLAKVMRTDSGRRLARPRTRAAADDARRGALWRPRAHGQRAEPAGRWVL